MRQSIAFFKNELTEVLRVMASFFTPYLASFSLLMLQLIAVAAFIFMAIGAVWSAMGHANELGLWGLKTLIFAVFWGLIYLGCLTLLSKLNSQKSSLG
jgi:hypothetical protein